MSETLELHPALLLPLLAAGLLAFARLARRRARLKALLPALSLLALLLAVGGLGGAALEKRLPWFWLLLLLPLLVLTVRGVVLVLEELVAGRVVNRIEVPGDVADPARTALERMLAAKP